MADADEIYQFSLNRQEGLDRPAGSPRLNSLSSAPLSRQDPNSVAAAHLSIALVGPDEERRTVLATTLAGLPGNVVREYSSYPPTLDQVPKMLDRQYDVLIIDLDSDLEYALELVESICAQGSATVMVYSAKVDQEHVVRCMRAGAREFLIPPFEQSVIAEALVRASTAVRHEIRQGKRTRGRLLAFLGTKGGSGVTTIACNFAIALGQESGQSTLLIDLGLPLGDAALNLGIISDFSTDHAFHDIARLDTTFLCKLLAKHRSGISVLAAPSQVPKAQASIEAVDKLMKAARQGFENVIVDVGSRLDLMGSALFKEASTVYLVTQAGISELRNSNRVISQFFNGSSATLEVVVNRYEPQTLGLTDEHITKALNRRAQWKIPDDYDTARQMQSTATPGTLLDSPMSRLIRQMARSSCGLPPIPEKPTGFKLRSFGRNTAKKASIGEEPPASTGATPTIAWSTPEPIVYGTRLETTQLDATASVPGTFAYAPAAGYVLPAGTHTLWVTFIAADTSSDTPVQTSVPITVSKATPTITWLTPPDIACGTALSATQLSATASVPGAFAYTPAAGEVLTGGRHELSVTFTPTDAANYTPAQATISVTVVKATPAISWSTPASIPCGTALSQTQLNATASVPGKFAYTPAAGDLLAPGKHILSVTFTPADTSGYTTAQAKVELTVIKSMPAIAWPTPEPITYGTRLSDTQIHATASVPGTFTYTPCDGAMLAAGTHTPFVTFTPRDTTKYAKAQAAVTLTVNKAEPTVSWDTPGPISDGTPLSAAQLNATASVPGTFIYTPAAGQTLPAGTHLLAVAFTPMDAENYNAMQATASITVTKTTTPTIKWKPPAAIAYGSALSSAQLNATSSIEGTFVYSPAAGDVLTAGKHKLHVTLTPKDTMKYATAQLMEVIEVEGVPNLDSLLKARTQTPFKAIETEDRVGLADAGQEASASSSAPRQHRKPETRIYKGAIYEKGEDGQWHLQRK
jgi:Flp pilus assembly CpaE family ATPase